MAGEDDINLSQINTILYKVKTLGKCTIGMLAISTIFKNYPLKYSMEPGVTGPTTRVKTVMAVFAFMFLILGSYVFANCFSNLDEIFLKSPYICVACSCTFSV